MSRDESVPLRGEETCATPTRSSLLGTGLPASLDPAATPDRQIAADSGRPPVAPVERSDEQQFIRGVDDHRLALVGAMLSFWGPVFEFVAKRLLHGYNRQVGDRGGMRQLLGHQE